ncbi:MAG: glycerol-3-phosphate dehydrogenase C-terminal domain-containing protein, partial [Gemmatimonadota bacterium]
TKGVHIVVPWKRLPLRDPTAVPAADGRLVFAVPEGRWTYIGTTDTREDGDVDDLGVGAAAVEYLVSTLRPVLDADLAVSDVAGAWAGWRPLVRVGSREDPDAIPREEVIEETAPGFLTVAGGKLTTYRRMAEETVDRVLDWLGRPAVPCRTDRRPLVPMSAGGAGPPAWASPEEVARVRELFGPDADDVFTRWAAEPESSEPLGSDFRHGTAEVERAAREMVETLEDLVDRRMSALPGGVPVDRETLYRVARAAAPVTGWDEARQRAEVTAFRAAAR